MRAVFARCKGWIPSAEDPIGELIFGFVWLIIDVHKSAPRQDILTLHECIQDPLLPYTIVQQSLIPPAALSIFGKCFKPGIPPAYEFRQEFCADLDSRRRPSDP